MYRGGRVRRYDTKVDDGYHRYDLIQIWEQLEVVAQHVVEMVDFFGNRLEARDGGHNACITFRQGQPAGGDGHEP